MRRLRHLSDMARGIAWVLFAHILREPERTRFEKDEAE